MTILVTGATGLVGARLIPRLAEAGFKCRALVRKEQKAIPGVDFVEGDMLDAKSLVEPIIGVEAIIHLAAVFRTQDTDAIWKANVEGARNLIETAKLHAPETRFIMASTGLVYNEDNGHPGREDDEIKPELAYPASKVVAENLLRESGLNWVIQRLAFVYGEKDGHLEMVPAVAQRFDWQSAKRMSMLHHQDIAVSMKLALSGAMDKLVVNICDDAVMSIYEIAKLVGEPMPDSAESLTHPWHCQMDVSLARKLGFQPGVRSLYQAAHEGIL